MFRIRKITNPCLEGNRQAVEKIKSIMKQQFSAVSAEQIDDIPRQMTNPVRKKYYTSLIIADDIHGNIRGFAVLMYMSDLQFCYLDYLAVTPGRPTSGVGGSLYERVREEAVSLDTTGLFFECLPDDPGLCRDQTSLSQNKKRLAFYERYGAYPVINTKYETPVKEEDDCAPYLVYDDLGTARPLKASELRKIIRAILKRKYSAYCPADYINMVVRSVKDDPVKLRPPRYARAPKEDEIKTIKNNNLKFRLFVNGNIKSIM
jgi:hypothetical protein